MAPKMALIGKAQFRRDARDAVAEAKPQACLVEPAYKPMSVRWHTELPGKFPAEAFATQRIARGEVVIGSKPVTGVGRVSAAGR